MEALKQALGKFEGKRILVMGDVILDKFSWGKIERINPEQPASSLVRIYEENYALGGAANVANNVKSLGAECCLYGFVGKDENGKEIGNLCSRRGIEWKEFFRKEPTIVKQRVMAHGQQVVRLDHGELNLVKMKREALNLNEEVIKEVENELDEFDFIILSDYDKDFFNKELTTKLIQMANSRNIRIAVDPKPSNIDYFKGCTVVRPNKKEAAQITNLRYSNGIETLEKIGRALSELCNSKYAVITCGKDGVFGYDRGNRDHFFAETKAREVADVTGAGDTFIAALSLGLASDLRLRDAITIANYAAGNVVEKVGTETTTIKEILSRITEEEKIPNNKVYKLLKSRHYEDSPSD